MSGVSLVLQGIAHALGVLSPRPSPLRAPSALEHPKTTSLRSRETPRAHAVSLRFAETARHWGPLSVGVRVQRVVGRHAHAWTSSQQPSAVRAAGPTARPAHSSTHLIEADVDAAFPRLFFLGRRDPTDPLV